jgi:hypothetical protein
MGISFFRVNPVGVLPGRHNRISNHNSCECSRPPLLPTFQPKQERGSRIIARSVSGDFERCSQCLCGRHIFFCEIIPPKCQDPFRNDRPLDCCFLLGDSNSSVYRRRKPRHAVSSLHIGRHLILVFPSGITS